MAEYGLTSGQGNSNLPSLVPSWPVATAVENEVKSKKKSKKKKFKIRTRDVNHTKVASRHELNSHVLPDGRGSRVS